MKKALLSLFLLFSIIVFSQEQENQDENKKTKPLSLPETFVSIYGIHYNNTGNNFLSEAHKGNIGFGTHINLLNVYGITFGGVLELTSFRVSDRSLAGNISKTNYTNFSGRINYDFNLTEKFSLAPYVGIGEITLKQKGDKNYGSFKGTSYHLGLNLNYKIGQRAFVFTGLNYNYTSYNVNSAPEYKSFFDKSNQIQIHFGIGF